MKKLSLLLFCILPLSTVSVAQEQEKHPIDREMEAAAQKDPSTRGRNSAYAAALDKWDAELNRHFKTLTKALDAPAAKKLRESQRAWVVWRDKELESLTAFFDKMDGTMWRPVHTFSAMDLTRQRALELNRLAGFLEDREE